MPVTADSDSSTPVISADGRYVLFSSAANNLVLTNSSGPVPNSVPHYMNTYVRDRVAGTTMLVSVNLQGTGGNGSSFPVEISTNGQYAVYESVADDLVANDSNTLNDIFIRDTINHTTVLVSASTNGMAGNGMSYGAVMTPAGRYVAFVSSANNLVPNDTNGIPDVFVRDVLSGTTTLVSTGAVSAASSSANGSALPAITPDGRFIAFYSTATNLVPGMTRIGEVYVRDRQTGTTVCASTNARVLFGSSNIVSCNHAISDDGRYVAFESFPTNVSTLAGRGGVFRHDLQTGVTDIVYTNANAPLTLSFENIHNLDMTPDGRFVALVANNTNSTGNTVINLWDAQTGTNIVVSVNFSNGLPVVGICDSPIFSAGGQSLAFLCNGTNVTTNTLVFGLATN
ncbi:MAG TPA: hypothetical protein VN625_09770, partial [Desulfuromonadaceae bacterium]|nr:hypothetical protein [Desulfuromonadaceae bacterium]